MGIGIALTCPHCHENVWMERVGQRELTPQPEPPPPAGIEGAALQAEKTRPSEKSKPPWLALILLAISLGTSMTGCGTAVMDFLTRVNPPTGYRPVDSVTAVVPMVIGIFVALSAAAVCVMRKSGTGIRIIVSIWAWVCFGAVVLESIWLAMGVVCLSIR